MVDKNKNTLRTKICIIMPGAYAFYLLNETNEIGGTELNLFWLAKEFATDNYFNISFIVGDYGQSSVECKDQIKFLRLKYWESMRAGKFNGIRHKIIRKLSLISSLFRDKSDIILLSTLGILVPYVVIVKKILLRKMIIFRLGSDNDINILYNSSFINRNIYKICFQLIDIIVVQNNWQKDSLKFDYKNKLHLIRNAIPINLSKKLPRKEYILWVGRAIPVKRPNLFLDIAETLQDQDFIMIMPVEDEYGMVVVDRAKSIHNLKLIDFIHPEEIITFYEGAKCFVNTSLYEGFPNTFIQSCFAKTPILSFNVDPDSIITTHKLGMKCDGSKDDAILFIKSLNHSKIKQLGENCYSYASKYHKYSSTIKKYRSLFIQ